MLSRILIGTSLLLVLAMPVTLEAEQRALLVGVGKYSVPGIDLPGIDLDLERVRETLNLMGFEDSQIRTLLDDQATSQKVIQGFEGWLKEDVQRNDRVVFYFSGHGSNTPDFNGDEPDGVDEVLVTHDVRRVREKGRAALSGVVTDDKLATLISSIPSDNVWVIVDACHSGTVTRSFELENKSLGSDPVFVKSFTYTDMPEGSETILERSFDKSGNVNFVSMSAAGDGEKAIGTARGGVFTIGLTKAIAAVAKEGGRVTVNQLRDQATEYIRSRVDKSRQHTPQVTGSDMLADGALEIIPVAGDNGPNRKRLVKLVDDQDNAFEIRASRQIYMIDDPVEFHLTIPADGYLNLVTVDSQDNATVLFPNYYNSDNLVRAGELSIPTKAMTFELPASEPLGPTLVAAFITKDAINFYAETLDDRDENGNITADFSALSHTATRAIRVAPQKKAMYAGRLEVSVIPRE